MLFEEFFKKKKINLTTLEKGQPELFFEFKEHYAQMGEKSFDHTKKYWFNRLRHEYPLPAEVKVDKVHIENQLAEQTVAEALTEPSPQTEAPKLGFKPKFKAGTTTIPAPAAEKTTEPVNETSASIATTDNTETPAADTPAKIGFKPRFKAGTTPKPATENTAPEEPKIAQNETASENAEQPAQLEFKPRFKAGVTANKPVEDNVAQEDSKTEPSEKPAEPTEQPAKLGFKPRFKAGVTTSKPTKEAPVSLETKAEAKPTEAADNVTDTPSAETNDAPAAPKLGFKPRFKAGVTTTKSTEAAAPLEQPRTKAFEEKAEEKPTEEIPAAQPAVSEAPKLGFKPRFKAGVTITKPAEEVAAKSELKADEPVADEPKEELKPEAPAVKQPYKPRFTPGMIKPKPPTEGESE